MEKVLRLYEIPDVENIVTVIGSGDELPESGFSENDLFINLNVDGLYKAVENQSQQLQWVQIQFDETKYYRDQSSEIPLFFTFSQQYGLNEYDVSFPQNAERAAEITSFTYSATRMGNAPTISGTLMYRQCLDELWTDRVCVFFNKKFYFIDKIPTSEYNNTDERYKHSCEFVSENKLLENVYFTNVVDIEHYEEDITKLPMQWLEFTFFGGISEFVSRLNLSLAYSGLDAQHVGFKVVKDTLPPVEEKLITISETTLKSALDLIYETWEIPYWFDGYTIHIGYSNEQQMQQAGITMPTFQYGAVQSLLSLQKSQSNDIVNRITGVGSSDNIPTFYPNKNPNAIELQYQRNQTLMVDYARIANPYKTARLKPSDASHQGVPNGTYFKYMPIKKTYTFDQFVTINTHENKIIEYENGVPQLVQANVYNENLNLKYMAFPIQSGSFAAGNIEYVRTQAYKVAYFWLKEGNLETLDITDSCNPYDFVPMDVLKTVTFQQAFKGFLKISAHNITRERYDQIVQLYGVPNSVENETELVSKSFSIDIQSEQDQSTGNTIWKGKLVWDDSSVTETYDEVAQFSYNSLPANTTCIILRFDIQVTAKNIPYKSEGSNVFDRMWYAETYDALFAKLKDGTKSIFVQTFYDLYPDWSLNADGHATHLWRYGIRLNSGVTPLENDIIYFTKEAGALPYFGQLLPYSFRDTNDIWLNAKNNEYLKENGTDYYSFENLYKISCAKEHVENFDDIKPTIKGMLNNETPAKHIDQILDVAFDQDDNNDLQENGTDYQHPYFFVKLAKTSLDDGYGFNLFDCAIEGDTMKLNMADGNCGGCTFEVMVKYQSDGMAYNPVGVFEQATTINGVTYPAGSPRRNLQTGDVLVNRKEDIQQDTSASEVWIALKKDNETFGSYANGAEVVLPDSKRGENFIPKEGDSFTIINICLPYAYIVAAEQKLYHALLDYMEKNNPRTWSFSVKFSSIYYKDHYEFMDKWFNESSEVPFVYNNITRKYFVQSYSYKMSSNSSLPEVTVELNEKVKKRNVYYPVPYNPYQNVGYEQSQAKKLYTSIINSVLGNTATPSDYNVNDLMVNGDITLSDGTSLNAQIIALNSQILNNERMQTKDNVWSKIKNVAEAENLFKDGLFASEYNDYTQTDVTVSKLEAGVFGKDGLRIELGDKNDAGVLFEQKIYVDEDSYYTIVFYAKSESSIAIDTNVHFYSNKDTLIKTEEYKNRQLGEDWNKIVYLTKTPQDSFYLKISMQKSETNE